MKPEIQKLRNLAQLYKEGKISKQEFDKKRQIGIYVI